MQCFSQQFFWFGHWRPKGGWGNFPHIFIVLIGSCAYWPVLIKRLLTVLWVSSACFEHSPSTYRSDWICGVTLASMSSSKLIPAKLALPQASLFCVLPQSGLTLIIEYCIQVILHHAHCHIAIHTLPHLIPFPSFQHFKRRKNSP